MYLDGHHFRTAQREKYLGVELTEGGITDAGTRERLRTVVKHTRALIQSAWWSMDMPPGQVSVQINNLIRLVYKYGMLLLQLSHNTVEEDEGQVDEVVKSMINKRQTVSVTARARLYDLFQVEGMARILGREVNVVVVRWIENSKEEGKAGRCGAGSLVQVRSIKWTTSLHQELRNREGSDGEDVTDSRLDWTRRWNESTGSRRGRENKGGKGPQYDRRPLQIT